MTTRAELDLTSLETYRESCLRIARQRLSRFSSMEKIAEAEADLNVYPNLDQLEDPGDIRVLDPESVPADDLEQARRAVLDGRVFWEHTAAGEATRLKLGRQVSDLSGGRPHAPGRHGRTAGRRKGRAGFSG